MSEHLEVRTETRPDGVTIVAADGELDLSSATMMEAELGDVLGSEAEHVIIDLRGLTFMDSVGLSVLVKADVRLAAESRRFGLVKGGDQVQRLLSLTGMAERVSLADTPEELIVGD